MARFREDQFQDTIKLNSLGFVVCPTCTTTCMLFPQMEVNGLALLKLEHSFIEKNNGKKMSQCHIPVPNSDQTK